MYGNFLPPGSKGQAGLNHCFSFYRSLGNREDLGSGESPELLGPRIDGIDLVAELARDPVLETIGGLVVRQEPQRLNHPGDPEMVVVVGVPPPCRVE